MSIILICMPSRFYAEKDKELFLYGRKRFLCFFTFIFCSTIHAIEVIDLPIPDLSDARIIRYSTGLRPYRASGIRLEAESIGDKLIIHDYGHGGAGISLSWGCAQEAVRIMEQHKDHQEPIAIIGAGVIGLTTAHLLSDQGYAVKVYARDFVPFTTSNKAAGLFTPGFGLGAFEEVLAGRLKAYSYAKYYALATSINPEFRGVHIRTAYEEEYNVKMEDASPDLHVLVRVNGATKVCIKSERLVFDLDLYLQDLFYQAQNKHISFEQKNIVSIADLLALPEAIIFNCTGLGSRELFHDVDLIPIKGHLIVYESQPGIDFVISKFHQERDSFFSLIPWESQLLLGGTLEEGIEDLDIDEEKLACLRRNANDFFSL